MSEDNHSTESDRRLVTVMFADISGFTAMSEKMDAEEVTDIMNECFRFMGECIEQHGGTIDKFIGDCVMALFGAPKTLEDGPHRAIETALEVKNKLLRFNEEKHLPIDLSFHIGINTGPVIAGMVGSESKQDFTVMGDTVNLASRIEGAAETGIILVSENTFRLTEGYFEFEPVGEIKVKGKEQPVRAYKVLGPRHVSTRIDACLGKGLSPFVGRTVELQHLGRCLEQACEGHGQVVGVVGEPGVGKSRLVCQFRDSLRAEDYTLIEGGCIHYGDAIPYLPVLDLLKHYFDIKEDEQESSIKEKISEKVSRINIQPSQVLPPLYEILSLTGEDKEYLKLDGKQRRNKVFDAIRLILIAESRIKPLIVTVEDLHWIDKTSEEFLSYLINSIGATRIMLILLFRPEYNPSWSTKTFYSQVRVDHLSKKTSADLLQGILSGGVDASLGDFIVVRTEGNPLFIEELTQSLMENGSIRKEEDRYLLTIKQSDIQVPATIQGIIAARLDRLEGRLKGIMQTASVIGREFAFRILQAVATLKEDLKSSLLTLQDLEFIYEKSLFPELEYIFKHALTQEVAYNSLLIKRRKETHEKVGQAIEQIYADRLEEFYEMLAYHYSLSENPHKAYEYLKLSGDKAAKNHSNWEAVRFYTKAMKALDKQNESEELKKKKLKLCQLTITPLMLLGYPEGTIEIFQKGEELAQEVGDERVLAIFYSKLSHYHATVGGSMECAMDYSEKCFHMAEKIESINLMALNADQICMVNWIAGNFPKAVDTSRRALQLIEGHHREKNLILGGINMYSQFCGWCGTSLGFLGEFHEGKEILDKGLKIAQEIGDKYGVGWVEFMYSCVFYMEGDGSNTIRHALNAIQQFEESGADILMGLSWIMHGFGNHQLGDYNTAIDHAEKGLKLQKKVGAPFLTAWAYDHLAGIQLAAGNLIRAKECAEEALKSAGESKAKPCEGVGLIILGSIKGKEDPGHIDEAHQNIHGGIAMLEELEARPIYAQGYIFLGELLADVGRKEEALENLKKAESLYLEIKVTPKSYWLKRTQEALAKLG